jgi:hypothetical protein
MKKIGLLLGILCFLTNGAFALGFKTVSSRAAAMGGAYTALAEGSLGMYYNPAGLARQKGFDLSIGFNAIGDNYIDNDIIDDFNDLTDILDKNYNASNIASINSDFNAAAVIIERIKNKVNGKPYLISVEPDAGFGFRFGCFGIYATTSNIAYVNANLDTVVVTGIGVSSDIAPSDTTTISGYASVVGEIGVSVGINMEKLTATPAFKNIDLGLTLKAIGGVSRYVGEKGLKDLEDFAEDDLEVDDFSMDELKLTFDFGIKYSTLDKKLVFALTGKNLTGPEIDADDNQYSQKIEIDPMVRFGVCYKPFKRLTMTADYDITKNEIGFSPQYNQLTGKVISGKKYESQELGLGIEFRPFNWKRFDLPIRVGYKKNLAESNASTMYTGGIGLKFLFFQIDIAGGINDDLEYEEREKFGNVNVSLFF